MPHYHNTQTRRKTTTEPSSSKARVKPKKIVVIRPVEHAPSRAPAPRPGHFHGGHEQCEPKNDRDRAQRARAAIGAERAVYRQQGILGESLGSMRRDYRQRALMNDFGKNTPHETEYKVAGKSYYAKERPRQVPVQEVAARYHVAVQHEDELLRMGRDPWAMSAGERVDRVTTSPQRHVAAVPKAEFDARFRTLREAHLKQDRQGEVQYFNIPNGRDDEEWFKVDLNRHKEQFRGPHAKRGKPRKSSRSCSWLGKLFGGL